MMTGKSAAQVPVLEDTEDMIAEINMTPSIRLFSLVPNARTTRSPIICARPVWNIAALMTNMPAKRTTVELDNPEKTVMLGFDILKRGSTK